MLLRFWGVRGSVPVPGESTLSVGGNTSCVSVEHGEEIYVFDAGSGIRLLGQYIEEDERSHWRGCVFLSHYHWDHIQGLPFFLPAFRAENRFHLYGETKRGASLHDILAEQMETPYFPVSMDAQEGIVTFNAIEPGETKNLSENLQVDTIALNHPGGAVGYRLTGPQGSICIITDHEHPNEGLSRDVVEFARGASVLIHEAPYEPAEKRGPKQGWGHSSWQEAANVALEADVGTLYLTHHEPARSDAELQEVLEKARGVFGRTELATETTWLDLDSRAS